ncbi:MAG: hypothetical protein J6U49_02545, partial [Alistipes sp.]|nr:hypothetical protein [Alistipes sp.]
NSLLFIGTKILNLHLYAKWGKPTNPHHHNFLSEWCKIGDDKEKERMGYTAMYFPFALWIEVAK